MRYQTLSYLFFEELSLTQEIRSKTQTNLLDTSIIRFDWKIKDKKKWYVQFGSWSIICLDK